MVFAIIERTGAKKGGSAAWKISDLPDTLPVDKNTIPLADSIAELVLILIFCGFAMLLCSGLIPFSFIINNGSTKIMHFFNPSFLAACLPVLALVGLLGSGATIVKIRYRRWTPMVCGAVLADSLLSMAAMIYLINRPDMLSMELAGFLQSVNPTLLNIGGNNITPTVTILLSIIIAATALGECAKAVYRTYKSGGQRPKHKSNC